MAAGLKGLGQDGEAAAPAGSIACQFSAQQKNRCSVLILAAGP
jgi:hypothetical protein